MENKIKGGKAAKMSIQDIAKKHNVDISVIQKQIQMGIKVEKEHTPSDAMAKEIAMDHLAEFPDYYTRLNKMEKEGEKALEAKESMGADASGSFEGPFSGTILKKDIHKLSNWPKQKEVKEVTGASVSAGAVYDAPPRGLGKAKRDPLSIDTPTKSASITAAPQEGMKATQKGFPKFGGPDGKFVEIDNRCKKFPYCNQGDDNQIKLKESHIVSLYESRDVQKVIKEVANKYGLSVKSVQKMVLKEIINESLPKAMFDEPSNLKALRSWTDKGVKIIYHVTTDEPLSIKTDDDVEIAKLKLIFYKHDIPFKVDKSIK